ncbi:MAG TPA: hypothetical protein DCE71_01400 [Parachlamydiales bacterium]|nr:hypothetical protein [Parachlamydiales bacterium]
MAQGIKPPRKQGPLIYFIPLGEEAKEKCFALATLCRRHHLSAEIELSSKKVQTGLQNASKVNSAYCAIIGSDELSSNQISVKHLETRQSVDLSLDHLISYLQGTKP